MTTTCSIGCGKSALASNFYDLLPDMTSTPPKPGYPVGISVILLNEKNKVLMLQRADCGEWCCPGGTLERGEGFMKGAARELLEEVGCTIQGVFSPAGFRQGHYRDGSPFVTLYVAAKVLGTPQNMEPEKHTDMQWFSPKEIPWDAWGRDHVVNYLCTVGWVE